MNIDKTLLAIRKMKCTLEGALAQYRNLEKLENRAEIAMAYNELPQIRSLKKRWNAIVTDCRTDLHRWHDTLRCERDTIVLCASVRRGGETASDRECLTNLDTAARLVEEALAL